MPSVNNPLKICLLSYRSNPHCGGQGVYIKNLSRALKDLGHHVDLLLGPPDHSFSNNGNVIRLPGLDLYNPENPFRVPTLKELADPINIMEWLGVSTMGFPEPFTFGMRAYLFLRRRYQDYDIIHDNQSLSYGIWAIKNMAPTIATIHHPITVDRKIAVSEAPSIFKKMKEMRWYSFIGMQKRVSRKFSHLITVSECARNDISREFNIPRPRFRIVPNGINTDQFYPLREIKRQKSRIIVTNSADMPLKGLQHLLLAIKEISRKKNVRLIVVGQPKKNGRIVKLIRTLGIGKYLTFTGRIDQQAFIEQYAKAWLAVIPSVYEGFGLPAGEAMACGLPVVSTAGGALPEVVGDAGILVPPADSQALARAITELLDNPYRARELGEAGYKRVHTLFTWEKAARKTVAAYAEVMDDYGRLSKTLH